MGCGSSSTVDAKKPGALIGKPTFSGDDTTVLFGGLLYRIINTNTHQWAFYNNSKDYEFHIQYLYGLDSDIQPLESTKMTKNDDGILCSCVVYPLETNMFISGFPDGYESKLEALQLSEEYFAAHPTLDEDAYYKRLAPPPAKDF